MEKLFRQKKKNNRVWLLVFGETGLGTIEVYISMLGTADIDDLVNDVC